MSTLQQPEGARMYGSLYNQRGKKGDKQESQRMNEYAAKEDQFEGETR